MKKTLLLALTVFGLTSQINAQDDASKKFRFGLKISPSINWLKIGDEKTFKKGGSVMKFGYGLVTEFRITDVASFSTGFQIDYDGGKVDMLDTVGYFYNEDKGFLENEKVNYSDSNSTAGYTPHLLNNRTYNSMYLSIPLQIKLRTKEIGYMTYYGNIGLLASIHIRTRATDGVTTWDNNGNSVKSEIEKLDISKDMNFLKTGLVIGGGAEMNLSGSTSVFFGLSYMQGFMNTVKKESKFNIDGEKTTGTKPTAQEQKFLGQNITLTVGVLF